MAALVINSSISKSMYLDLGEMSCSFGAGTGVKTQTALGLPEP